jgi:riboflavin synthase
VFSGIVEGIGRIEAFELRGSGARITVLPPARFGRFRKGESISVSGVCLTALSGSRRFTADLSAETLSRSTLGSLVPGGRVNLERAVRPVDRLSGHLVAGHVDGLAEVRSIRRGRDSTLFRFTVPTELARYVVEKGSVALDGVSLTAYELRGASFRVSVVPHTLRVTTLGQRRRGDRLNFEADVLAKYVESLLAAR